MRTLSLFFWCVLLLASTACGWQASPNPATIRNEDGISGPVQVTDVANDPANTIIMAGSSTVFPLAVHMARAYQSSGYGGKIAIDSVGSGGGFKMFCDSAETDIANASREIKAGELQSCAALGRSPLAFLVGTDALVITVSKANTFVDDVTLEELALIYGDAETWADVNPDWPAEPIIRFSPGRSSGTFDFFVENVFDKDDQRMLASSNLQLSEDDDVLVAALKASPYAISFFGYAYYLENRDALRVIDINGVTPTRLTAEDGSYPLARPLYIYSDANVMRDKPDVGRFVQFFLNRVNDHIEEVGYFPASDDALNEARNVLNEALTN